MWVAEISGKTHRCQEEHEIRVGAIVMRCGCATSATTTFLHAVQQPSLENLRKFITEAIARIGNML